MSSLRQPSRAASDDAILRTFGVTFDTEGVVPPQALDWNQLIYASRGVMTVLTEVGAFVVPSHRAVWVPAHVTYRVEMTGPVAMRTVYVAARYARGLPKDCRVVNVSPLLRELVLFAVSRGALRRGVAKDERLARVILDQLQTMGRAPLQLPIPKEPRAERVARFVLDDPSESATLAELARRAGASARTIERAFVEGVHMTFGRFRQRARLLHALRLLAGGEAVTSVALDCGYASPSAFIAMFRRELGTTPSRYFQRGVS